MNLLQDPNPDPNNCLICQYAIIKPNELGKFARSLGILYLAKKFEQYPVVFCSKEEGYQKGGKYVVDPLHKPRWCKR